MIKSRLGYSKNEKRRAVFALIILIPWIIGIIRFFVIPTIYTVIYSINTISISSTGDGFLYDFVGLSNYKAIFVTDSNFLRSFVSAISDMLLNVPVIVFFSLFTAIVLKNKFFGRTAFRAIFFLPVIIASGVVISVLKENVMTSGMQTVAAEQTSYIFAAPSFVEIFANLNVPKSLLNFVTDVVNRLFDLTWKSGVQILLLLAAVNNVSSSVYEAADIEGANGWEKFWKITFPMVSPTLLVSVVYTIIDSFTDYDNVIIQMITQHFSEGKLSYSSAVGFTYFIAILLIIGIIYGIIGKFVFYENKR